MITVRMATHEDVGHCKALVDAHRDVFGFIVRSVLHEAIEHHQILVAEIDGAVAGFVRYYHRVNDGQTTLYDLCVAREYRGAGAGRALVEALQAECEARYRDAIVLRCPAHLEANTFYHHIGFHHIRTDAGRKRALNVWCLPIARGRLL